jgi:DNA-binding GntR family transcriptional regulator
MEKLVEMSAHRDARVVPASPQHFRYLYEVRLELDPLAAGLAAERATKAEIDAIARVASAQGRTALKQASVNRRFHRAVYSSCHNPVLVDQLDSLWDRTDSYRLALLSAYPSEAVLANHEHTAIATAIRDRNAAEVRALVRAHLEDSFSKVESLMETDSTAPAAAAGSQKPIGRK